MEEYIYKFHSDEISNILRSKSTEISINFDLSNLLNENLKLFDELKWKFDEELAKWKKTVISQVSKIIIKDNIQLPNKKIELNIDFYNHPQRIEWPKITSDLFQLVEFKGYVFRSSTPKKLENLREVACVKCKQTMMLKADRQFDYAFKCSRKCTIKEDCDGKMVFTRKPEEIPPMENTIDFQVLKVQELDKFTPKNRFYAIECEGKLVDSCSIGDTITVLGTFETRNDLQSKEIKRVVIRAINITKAFEFKHSINSGEREATYKAWITDKIRNNDNELEARDEMCKAVAPELNNCFILKLALLIVLCTGGRSKQVKSQTQRFERMTNRDISHLLFIGLPGLGKSQLLRAASKISSRAIKCVGSACTLAGLTASSYREDKETHVEAGALVLGNNGICCIDEFNLLSLRNRGALHDAMEHQKFSFMQANLKVEVNARCSVIASMNHKAEQSGEAKNKNLKNTAFNIEPSLISRFDFVYFLEKPDDPDFDNKIVESIINGATVNYQEVALHWTMERLQLHIIGAKNLTCLLTEDVLKLLFNYYRFCNACEEVDGSRKTMRLLKSLERLTIGHAKLMLRKKTKLIDAVTIIWMMENSWSFGDLIEPTNVILSELPLGPTEECIRHIFDTLQLSELYSVFEKEQREDDTVCASEFSHNEDMKQKKELKMPFNKSTVIKRKSNERKTSEKTVINDELPEELRKSFAINNINDLFDDSDEDECVVNQENGMSAIDMISVNGLEELLLNQMDDLEDDDFKDLMEKNSSTQVEQPGPSTKSVPPQNVMKKSEEVKKVTSLGNLLTSKHVRDENSKRRKLSSDVEDLFNVFTDDLPEKVPQKHDDPPNVMAIKKKTPPKLGFFERLKNFEYSSQKSQENGKENKKAPGLSESLLALSNQINGTNTEKPTANTSMTREEYLKALDDEMDLWN